MSKRNIANMLLEERMLLKISQRKMAEKIDISYPVYSGLEHGTYVPSLKILKLIAQYFNEDPKKIVDLYLTEGD